MTKDTLRKIPKLKKVTEGIVREYRPEKIILFGSHAWGKPTLDSDVDLMILKKGEKDKFKEERKIRKIIGGEMAVDILIYTPKEFEKQVKSGDFFFEDIFYKGKTLYEK